MTNCLETHRAEQAEAIELLREAFPGIGDAAAEGAAGKLRDWWIYRKGRWATVDEVRAYWKGRKEKLAIANPTSVTPIAAE